MAHVIFSSPIPSGDATMVVKLTDGRTLNLEIQRVNEVVEDGEPKEILDGELTTEFGLFKWSPKQKGYTQHDLIGGKARIYSHEYPAEAPTPAPRSLQQINGNLNFIKNRSLSSLN